MRDNRAPAHKIGERSHGLYSRGGIGHIGVCDACELSDFGRDQLLGMHKRVKAVNDLAARKTGRGNLDKFVVLDRKTRGLGIEDDNILLDKAKRLCAGTLGKRCIGINDKLRRSRRYSVLD